MPMPEIAFSLVVAKQRNGFRAAFEVTPPTERAWLRSKNVGPTPLAAVKLALAEIERMTKRTPGPVTHGRTAARYFKTGR